MRQISPIRKGEWITIRFTHGGFRYLLSGLGKWSNPEDLEKAQSIAQSIALDIHLGVFSCKDSKELAKIYLAVPTEHGLREKLTQRLKERFHTSDKTLLNHLDKWGRGVNTREDAIAFIYWLSKGLAPSYVNRHLITLKVLEPNLFKGLALKVPPKPLPYPFTRDEVRLDNP